MGYDGACGGQYKGRRDLYMTYAYCPCVSLDGMIRAHVTFAMPLLVCLPSFAFIRENENPKQSTCIPYSAWAFGGTKGLSVAGRYMSPCVGIH